ncbi:hypothetical protein DACRYDRAFT_22806 [Dacryopinax primogenitus]|uniref:Uncharacterized protein n=1 Tax=Dacryopinax primogenitus (strain DJM 731) TaxID=1858805 RepID=M5G552_DACPD|nr:uncharacterized protein DACRYDRAFT_22806 [Dacryopinax primogenitus]EJU00967.1 hypothetical protein DACRYDRAFT_22806 [Dacryopinax primogenitus]
MPFFAPTIPPHPLQEDVPASATPQSNGKDDEHPHRHHLQLYRGPTTHHPALCFLDGVMNLLSMRLAISKYRTVTSVCGNQI